jgi:hypothetical protein
LSFLSGQIARATAAEQYIHRIADILETHGWELQPANQAGKYKALATIHQEGIVHLKYQRITWRNPEET